MKSRYFIRNFEADRYMEIFLVSAVFAVLAIRLFLKITGYPQVGSSELHIAHMLWGGLLMLVSIVILLFFLSKRAMYLASLLGGLGFGTFIDEIGKFVTQDNDYFYEPSVALMYIIFILIFIVVNAIETRWHRTKEEYIVNALNELKEIPIEDLDEFERKRALSYLKKSGVHNDFIKTVTGIIVNTKPVSTPEPGIYTKVKSFLISFYGKITQYRFFNLGLVVFFTVQFLVTVMHIIGLTFYLGISPESLNGFWMIQDVNRNLDNITFIGIARYFSTLASGFFIFAGIYLLKKSRLRAFEMFRRALLVSIFLTQVFIFFREQFSGMTGLVLNILILMALEFMIDREREKLIRNV